MLLQSDTVVNITMDFVDFPYQAGHCCQKKSAWNWQQCQSRQEMSTPPKRQKGSRRSMSQNRKRTHINMQMPAVMKVTFNQF